jgi:hypothetical protein
MHLSFIVCKHAVLVKEATAHGRLYTHAIRMRSAIHPPYRVQRLLRSHKRRPVICMFQTVFRMRTHGRFKKSGPNALLFEPLFGKINDSLCTTRSISKFSSKNFLVRIFKKRGAIRDEIFSYGRLASRQDDARGEYVSRTT